MLACKWLSKRLAGARCEALLQSAETDGTGLLFRQPQAHVAAYSDRTRRAGLDGQVLCSDGQNVTVARGVVSSLSCEFP